MACNNNIIISNNNVTDINVIFSSEQIRLGSLVKVQACSIPHGSTVTFQSTDSSVAQIIPFTDCCCDNCFSRCFIKPISLGYFDLVLWSGDCKKIIKDLQVLPAEDDVTPDQPDQSPFNLSTESVVLKIGESYNIKVFPEEIGPEITWSSSRSDIASVRTANQDGGIVTGNAKGVSLITASARGYKKICTVEVSEIGINGSHFKIAIGQHFTIPIDVYPNNLTMYWSSVNNNIATVTNGVVTGVYLGTTIVTATVVTTTGPITQVFEVEVVNSFDPIIDLKSYDIKRLKIYDNETDLYNDNTATNIKVLPEGPFVPRLYYVKIDDNPYIFNYKICAIRDDIEKFNLRSNNREL